MLPSYIFPSDVAKMSIVYSSKIICISYGTHFLPYVTKIVVWSSDQSYLNCWKLKNVKLGRREKHWYNFFIKDIEFVTDYLIREYDNGVVVSDYCAKKYRESLEKKELQEIIETELL